MGETIVRTVKYKFKASDIIEAKVCFFFLLQSVEEQAFYWNINPKVIQSLKCHCKIAVLGILQGHFMLPQTECEHVSTGISVLVKTVAIETDENWS